MMDGNGIGEELAASLGLGEVVRIEQFRGEDDDGMLATVEQAEPVQLGGDERRAALLVRW